MMDRRTFVSTAAGALLVKALPANAQLAKKVPRIGVLYPGTPAAVAQSVEAFSQGLRELGYVEGQTLSWSAGSATPSPSGWPRSPPNWCA
jgi:putative tryptophan/tyrosine transport system substrate-binding protein